MIDVFISYSRANKDVACRLAETVKRLGYSVWWDEKLPAHLSHEEAIVEQVGAARAAIVIWSRGSAESKWVRAEAECARGRDILIQTVIDGFAPPAPRRPARRSLPHGKDARAVSRPTTRCSRATSPPRRGCGRRACRRANRK